MPKVGFEPTRACAHCALNAARLPVPPLRREVGAREKIDGAESRGNRPACVAEHHLCAEVVEWAEDDLFEVLP